MVCTSGNETIEIDSRTSDALALAVRIGCPIFTYENILEAAGLFMDQPAATAVSAPSAEEEQQEQPVSGSDLKGKTLEELNDLLQQVLDNEDYMQAVAIRDEIKKREGKA